ncbi:MAG: hypothetical protein BroJett038_24480 [Chloroflexota bacterium]|nr:MAG: hypothetical protein BroJett038_24480 [Chloroflexota bacterium]
MTKSRTIPNPSSVLLKNAVVGGAGLGMPPDATPPAGMGVVLLYVPLSDLTTMAAPDIQADLGLPWAVEGGGAAWFDEL